MNKKKYISIISSLVTAVVLCTAIIFFIKYQLEIKPQNVHKGGSTTTSSDITVSAEDETTTGELPVDERTFLVDNKTYSVYDILKPCNYYNNSIIYNNPDYLYDAYPEFVIDFVVAQSGKDDVSSYISEIYKAYASLFGEYFVVNNTLENTTVLDENTLERMNIFYEETFFPKDPDEALNTETTTSLETTSIQPLSDLENPSPAYSFPIEYAVLIQSECYIQYTDAKLSSEMKTDSETEYFIVFYASGKWYIDYMYTDYYFYN